jgi:hypothetical protein
MAIDFMRAEILHNGRISSAMRRLSHYFAPFQSFVVERAEEDVSRFEQHTAFRILEAEARYRAQAPTMAGLFIFQFECIARNRLGYADGLSAMAADPQFSDDWTEWIRRLQRELGSRDLADIVYGASQHFQNRRTTRVQNRSTVETSVAPPAPPARALFGDQEGRIARANIGRDPLYFFAALQRQLGYPMVPRSVSAEHVEKLPPALEARLNKIEQRVKLMEMEAKGGIDLSKFYKAAELASGADEATPDPAPRSAM